MFFSVVLPKISFRFAQMARNFWRRGSICRVRTDQGEFCNVLPSALTGHGCFTRGEWLDDLEKWSLAKQRLWSAGQCARLTKEDSAPPRFKLIEQCPPDWSREEANDCLLVV